MLCVGCTVAMTGVARIDLEQSAPLTAEKHRYIGTNPMRLYLPLRCRMLASVSGLGPSRYGLAGRLRLGVSQPSPSRRRSLPDVLRSCGTAPDRQCARRFPNWRLAIPAALSRTTRCSSVPG
jgi:hypothetical protein